MPTVTCPIPDHEPSQARREWRARSWEGMEHPATPTAEGRSWPRWSNMATRSPGPRVAAPTAGSSAQGLGGLEVDDELDLRRLLDREDARLRTLEDLIDVGGHAMEDHLHVGAIAHEPPASTKLRNS